MDAPTAGCPDGARRLRVLVVEDEPGIALFARRALSVAGYEVEVVACGGAALAALGRGHDAVVVDRGLPDVCGDEVARRAAALLPRPAIVVATGDVEAAMPPHDVGIEKPYGPVRLVAAVAEALAARDARRPADVALLAT